MSSVKSVSSTFHDLPFYNQWKDSVIAKARLYGIPEEIIEESSIEALVDTLSAHELEQVELSKRTYENYTTDLAKAANDNYLGEWELEVLATAEEYGIPYDLREIKWDKLVDTINEYEEVMGKAIDYGISWSLSHYDVVELRQKIEEKERKESKYEKDLYQDFFFSREIS